MYNSKKKNIFQKLKPFSSSDKKKIDLFAASILLGLGPVS